MGGSCGPACGDPFDRRGELPYPVVGAVVHEKRLFRLPELQQVVVSPQASLEGIELPAKYVYDIETQPGRTYSFVLSEGNADPEN